MPTEAALRPDLDDEPDSLAIARLMVRASGCERRGDGEGAARHYAQVLALDPSHALSMLRLANYHLQRQEPNEVLALIDRALALIPDEPGLLYTRGRALHLALRLDEAQAAFELADVMGSPPGQARFAQAGTLLMRIERTEEPLLWIYLQPKHAIYAQPGQRVDVRMPDGSWQEAAVLVALEM